MSVFHWKAARGEIRLGCGVGEVGLHVTLTPLTLCSSSSSLASLALTDTTVHEP